MNERLVIEKQDLKYLEWSKIRHSSGTAGSFLKAYSELGGKKIYYKLSNYDATKGVIGHESVNELVVDFLILNRDWHGANIEVLRNKKKKTIRLAPLFDHGLSLLCTCLTDEAIEKFDVKEDRLVQSYIASRSTKDNLALIPEDKLPGFKPLKKTDKAYLMNGLDGILSKKASGENMRHDLGTVVFL